MIVDLPSGKQLHRYDVSTPWDGMGDNWEAGPLYAGMSAALVNDVLPVADIVARTIAEARSSLGSAQSALAL